VRDVHRLAGDRLRGDAHVLPGVVAAVRVHERAAAGGPADRGAAQARGPGAGRRQAAGRHVGRARQRADDAADAVTDETRPQNIYDDPVFFDGYTQLLRFNAGFGSAMEHGPFLELLGDVAGERVLDLGCGGGQRAYRLAQDGAAHVTAIDASERMLAVARSRWAHANVTYERVAMEDAAYPDAAFDVIVSSLAF